MMRRMTEDERRVYEECCRDYNQNDPVHRDIRYVYFVSRSKGRGRKRREPVEVSLLSYRKGPFTSWNKFPFDDRATECLGRSVSPENAETEFIKQILNLRREFK